MGELVYLNSFSKGNFINVKVYFNKSLEDYQILTTSNFEKSFEKHLISNNYCLLYRGLLEIEVSKILKEKE